MGRQSTKMPEGAAGDPEQVWVPRLRTTNQAESFLGQLRRLYLTHR